MMPTVDGESLDSLDTAAGDSVGTDASIETTDAAAKGDSSADKGADTRLNDTQSALKDAQRELHATREMIAELRGAVNTLRDTKKAEPEVDWVNQEHFKTMVAKQMEDDPSAAVASIAEMVARNLRSDMAKILDLRDGAFRAEFGQQMAQANDPERAALKDTLAELSADDGFASLPAQAQLKLARKFAAQKTSQTVSPPSGVAGTGRRTPTSKGNEDIQKLIDAATDRAFGDGKRRDGKINAIVR